MCIFVSLVCALSLLSLYLTDFSERDSRKNVYNQEAHKREAHIAKQAVTQEQPQVDIITVCQSE